MRYRNARIFALKKGGFQITFDSGFKSFADTFEQAQNAVDIALSFKGTFTTRKTFLDHAKDSLEENAELYGALAEDD